jgi:protein phosphatase
VDIVERSDVGRVRETNEDVVMTSADNRVAVLADGMGGLEAGEIASSTAADEILNWLAARKEHTEATIHAAIATANSRIFRLTEAGGYPGMGTTVVLWVDVGFGQCLVAHVGDSRAYRFRAGQLERLTEDHSVVQQMINQGVLSELEARVSPNRNVITRAVGLEVAVAADVRSYVHASGDVFLLCSDGLTDMLTEVEIVSLLASQIGENGVGNLEAVADTLIAGANEAGGFDNISVVLIRPW